MSNTQINAHTKLLTSIKETNLAIDALNAPNSAQLKTVIARGICISSFTYIENYIQHRWKEVCLEINSYCTRSFTQHKPSKQGRIIKKQMQFTAAQKFNTHTQVLEATRTLSNILNAITNQSNILYSEDLFYPKGSNINERELKNAFALIIDNYIDLFETLQQQITATPINQNEESALKDFKDLKKLRHTAAHDPSFTPSLHTISREITQNVLTFCARFDLIVSKFASTQVTITDPNRKPKDITTEDFHNWRAIQIDSALSHLTVHDFDDTTFNLFTISHHTSSPKSIPVANVIQTLNPIIRAKFTLQNGQLDPNSIEDFLHEREVQLTINNIVPRIVSNGDNDNYFCLYYNHKFEIIDWRLEGSLAIG